MKRLVAMVGVVLLFGACGDGGGTIVAGGPGSNPDQPVSVVPDPDSPAGPGGDPAGAGTARRTSVVTRAVDLRPQPFESAVPLEGDRHLAVRFYLGVAPCSVLGRVDVREAADRVTVTLYSGRDPAAGDVACIEIAEYREVVVDLGAPLAGRQVVDGAAS